MTTIIGILFALASMFASGDRLGNDCQLGDPVVYEDMSYRIEPSDSVVVCDIQGTPENDLSFLAVAYNDETGEFTVTRFAYTIGQNIPDMTLLYAGNGKDR